MTENENLDSAYLDTDTGAINIREVIEKYRFHYKWFIAGIAVAVFFAYFYLRYTPRTYEVSSTILIDDKNGGIHSERSAFEELGILGGSQNSIDNEIGILKSRSLMERVVKDLELNISYFSVGKFSKLELHKDKLPFKISFFSKDSIFHKLGTSFILKRTSATNFTLKKSATEAETTHLFGESVKTDFGSFTVTPRNSDEGHLDTEIVVVVSPTESVAQGYRSRVRIAPADEKSSLINLTLQDGIKQKAIEILDYLVVQYNKDAIADKSFIGKNTDKFINERLTVISNDLTEVDKGVESFKTLNKLTNIDGEVDLILDTNNAIEQKIIALNTQLKLAHYVTEYVNSTKNELIPSNLGLADDAVSENTSQYNALILEYNRILNSSGKLNPILINLEEQILKFRKSIKQGLVNLKSSLTISLNDAKRQEGLLNSKITSVPKKEREFRDIQRQQQIVETLYLFLLQKREENAISLAVTEPNAKIIDAAYGSGAPIAPVSRKIYFLAILLGAAVPFMCIFLYSIFDNKLHTIEDLEKELDIMVLGDIPKVRSKEKFIMEEDGKGIVTESFRMLRTNVAFVLSKIKKESKTIFVTSTIKGEGKTFISINLARVLSLSGKKVLLVGADVRNPQIAQFLNTPKKPGLTHFLMDENMQAENLIQSMPDLGFDLLQSGSIPPNTSELLLNGRFEEMLAYGRQHYDFVIVDTAPVSLVTDTLLLSGNNADLFVYVVRANYLDKRLLKVPRKLFKTKRLQNMAILLNDTRPERTLGYGYGYGYEYGYGYSYGDASTKSWKDRLLTYFK